MPEEPVSPYERLLTPREAAARFGVRPSTLARWAREGQIGARLTPGGHRRYDPDEIRALRGGVEAKDFPTAECDAVRLYREGWSIRRVAAEFGMTYGSMRRLLRAHLTLRHRGGPVDPGRDPP
jgi:excisionase family DNA binding protein